MQKKKKQNVNKKDLFGKANYDTQIVTGIKIAVGVILVLGAVYLLTSILTGEIKLGSPKKKEITEPEIQYEEIIMGQILNREEKEYYVLGCNFTDSDATYYLSLKDSFKQNIDAIPFYIVDLEKGFNQALKPADGEKYAEKPSTIKDLKMSSPTILKVKDGKVTERIETKDKVKEYLEKIS